MQMMLLLNGNLDLKSYVYLLLPGELQFLLFSLHLFLSLLFHFNFLKLQSSWIYASFAVQFCREELGVCIIQRSLKPKDLNSFDFTGLKGNRITDSSVRSYDSNSYSICRFYKNYTSKDYEVFEPLIL